MGDDLVPSEITKLLGASPTAAESKGEKITKPKTGTTRIAKSGSWRLRAKSCEPENIDGQIAQILNQLTDDLTVWHEIKKRYRVDLFCGLFLGSSNEGLTISVKSLRALSERGIEAGFDIYALFDEE